MLNFSLYKLWLNYEWLKGNKFSHYQLKWNSFANLVPKSLTLFGILNSRVFEETLNAFKVFKNLRILRILSNPQQFILRLKFVCDFLCASEMGKNYQIGFWHLKCKKFLSHLQKNNELRPVSNFVRNFLIVHAGVIQRFPTGRFS